MRIPDTQHLSRPWRIHEVVRGFRLEDAWAVPLAGGPDDLPDVVAMLVSYDPARSSSFPVRALFGIRWWLGGLLGWDDPEDGLDGRVPTLRDRLPADLRDGPTGPAFDALPFSPLYLTHDEFAAEIANRTMHGVMHLGLVPDGDGRAHVEMAVYVRPAGLFGQVYMAAIKPFRHWLVYPPMMRECTREWQSRHDAVAP